MSKDYILQIAAEVRALKAIDPVDRKAVVPDFRKTPNVHGDALRVVSNICTLVDRAMQRRYNDDNIFSDAALALEAVHTTLQRLSQGLPSMLEVNAPSVAAVSRTRLMEISNLYSRSFSNIAIIEHLNKMVAGSEAYDLLPLLFVFERMNLAEALGEDLMMGLSTFGYAHAFIETLNTGALIAEAA